MLFFFIILDGLWFPQKILSSTAVFNNNNVRKRAENQHIRMISEGSCDTEDCFEIQL